jgi:signal transduction histidine kinase
MNRITTFWQRHKQPALPDWPDVLAWFLCGVALIHTTLLFYPINPYTPGALIVQSLYPIGIAGATVIMVEAARLHSGRQRWAWILQTGSLLCGLIRTILLIRARYVSLSEATRLNDTLYLLMYCFALGGIVLYLPWRVWWLGTAPRVLIDSVLVGSATLVILQSTVPLFVTPWTAARSHALLMPAFNLAALFAIGTVSLRYGRSGGPLLALSLASIVCLLCGDTILTVIQLLPDIPPMSVSVAPLYTLHYVFRARAAYRGAIQPPRAPEVPYTVMPLTHWFILALLPRVMLLAGLTCTLTLAPAPLQTVLALLVVAGLRELIAALDQRRVLRALHLAQAEAHAGATQTVDFLARIVHDVAAPLQGLRTLADSASPSPAAAAITAPLRDQLTHLDHLVDQLRSYLQSRTGPVLIRPVNVAPICAAALRAAEGHAEVQRVNLRLVFDIEMTMVAGDAGAIRRLLDNLLVNAIDVSPPEQEVVLRVYAEDDRTITLSVSDRGPGLSPDQQTHIFEPLVRFRGGSGLGLGLAIVRELTRGMHGTYGVQSEVGRGSTFWIRLPRADLDLKEESDADSLGDR